MNPQSYIRTAMKRIKGDDLERYQREFGHFTANEMNEEHGQSGHTRNEILSGCIAQRNDHNKSLEALKRAGL